MNAGINIQNYVLCQPTAKFSRWKTFLFSNKIDILLLEKVFVACLFKGLDCFQKTFCIA